MSGNKGDNNLPAVIVLSPRINDLDVDNSESGSNHKKQRRKKRVINTMEFVNRHSSKKVCHDTIEYNIVKNICKGSIETVDMVGKCHNLSYRESPSVTDGLTHATLHEGSVVTVDAAKKCHNLSYNN